MSNMRHNEIVKTPNGDARLQAQWYLPDDDKHGEPTGVLVRHMPKAEIDLALCQDVRSSSNRDGWLVVYRQEEVT